MILIPSICPKCSSTLERVNDQIFCRNSECSGTVLKRIASFCKKMKIKGLGEASLTKLNLTGIPDLYSLTEEEIANILNSKVLAEKIMLEIEKSKSCTLQDFIGSLSIPLVGRTIATSIVGDNLEDFDYSKLGAKAQESLENWIENESEKYLYLPINFIKEDKKITSAVVCMSGRLNGITKAQAEATLSQRNVGVVTSVKDGIDALICDNPSGSAKEVRAAALGIEILTLNEYLKGL